MTKEDTKDNKQSTTTQTPVAPTRISFNSPRLWTYCVKPPTKSMVDNSQKVTLVSETKNNNTKK
ncbi:hypothetical protein [Candidatus Enterovibrio altilux]|uniref:hypothetical protein n=1 Tax=Candidatus Enterovibrio altilux TaxID=1927128 RepID=UPI000BBBEF97|nr:hypothetical protein [Candidatus Enterovibrio luxaltus]